jgi:uncharacterized lipoprotein YajG
MNFVQSRRGFVITAAAVALAGCATTPALLAASPAETFPELEPLLAAEAGADGLTIRVTSKGCAAKADFVFRVDRKAGHAVVAFARRRLETCKGMTGSAELRFSYDELGLTHGERVVIANSINPSA